MEEKFVSEDVQIMILKLLNPRDIYSFGNTCRRALTITGKVWKIKTREEFPYWYDTTIVRKTFSEKRFRWFKYYMNLHIRDFNTDIFEFINMIDRSAEIRKKTRNFEKLLEYMTRKFYLVKIRRLSGVRNVLQEKLICMKDHLFVDEYFKKLFPETYLEEFSYNLDELFTV